MIPISSDALRDPSFSAAGETRAADAAAGAPAPEIQRRGVRFTESQVWHGCSLDSLLEADDGGLADIAGALELEDWSAGTFEARTLRLEALAELSAGLPECLPALPSLAHWLVAATVGVTLTAPAGQDPRLRLFAGLDRDALLHLKDAEVYRDHREELLTVRFLLISAPQHSPLGLCRALMSSRPVPLPWELYLASDFWAQDLLQVLHSTLLWNDVEESLPPGSREFLEASGWARQGAIEESLLALLDWMEKAGPQQVVELGHELYCELAQALLNPRHLKQALEWLALAGPVAEPGHPEPPARVLHIQDGTVSPAPKAPAPSAEGDERAVVRSPAPEGPARAHWEELVRRALQAPFEGGAPLIQAAQRALEGALRWQQSCPAASQIAVEVLADLPVEQLQALLSGAQLMVTLQSDLEPSLDHLLQRVSQQLAPTLRQEWTHMRRIAAQWGDAQASAMAGVLAELFLHGLEADHHLFALADCGQRLRLLTGLEFEKAERREEVAGRAREAGPGMSRRWEAIDEALYHYVEWRCGGVNSGQLRDLQAGLMGIRQQVVLALEANRPLRALRADFQGRLTKLRALSDALEELPLVLRQQCSSAFLSMGKAIAEWQTRLEGWVESLRILKQDPENLQAHRTEQRSYDALRRGAGLAILRMRELVCLLDLPDWSGTDLIEQLAAAACVWGRGLRQLRRSVAVEGRVDAVALTGAPNIDQINASVQRVYLRIIDKKRGLDGALCSLAFASQGLLQGGFGRIVLGASSAEAVGALWAQTVDLAVQRQAWSTAQAMILRRLRGLPVWSSSAMELCRPECGPHHTSRNEPAQHQWPRLGMEGRVEAIQAWEVFWKGLGASQRSQSARVSGANDRTFSLEVLRQNTTPEERRGIYGRHRRSLFGGSWLAPVLRTARQAGFRELADELEAAARELLPQGESREQESPETAWRHDAATQSVTAILPQLLERFNQGALADP